MAHFRSTRHNLNITTTRLSNANHRVRISHLHHLTINKQGHLPHLRRLVPNINPTARIRRKPTTISGNDEFKNSNLRSEHTRHARNGNRRWVRVFPRAALGFLRETGVQGFAFFPCERAGCVPQPSSPRATTFTSIRGCPCLTTSLVHWASVQ